MPASSKMESSFYPAGTLSERRLKEPGLELLRLGGGSERAAPAFLMHSSRDAVTAIGLHGGRAAAEGAEDEDRRDK
jgi:hypothetical protein